MKRKILIDISVTVLFSITTALAQDLISFGNDSLSFTNMNSNPYYFTVESLPNLDGLEERDSTYNGLRNIHLPDGTITLPVGKYSRGVGRTNPIYSVGGNAAAGDILTGKTAYVNDGEINGTMPNRGTVNFTPSTATQVISQGYHSGSGSVAGSANLVPSNIKLGVNIFGVNGSVVGATGSAADSSVLAGQIFSCAGAVNRTGTMPNRSGHVSAQSSSISGTTLRFRPQSGYYAGTSGNSAQFSDANFIAANIKSGISIFGIAGTYSGVSMAVARTGQSISYRSGDDASVGAGATWPVPRFSVQSNTNVVLDNLTGLIWARDAKGISNETWNDAIDYCNELTFGGFSDWRLPNINELLSIIDWSQRNPCLPSGHPFTNVKNLIYWSSTTDAINAAHVPSVYLVNGQVLRCDKALPQQAWPVRGP